MDLNHFNVRAVNSRKPSAFIVVDGAGAQLPPAGEDWGSLALQ
jgi:hypothetical protein